MSSTGAAGAWSYRTGPWFAAFGPRVTVLLPESQRDQVVGVWSLVDGGAAFDEVLDALLASGLSRLPGFVLVSTDEGPTRVLLRGSGVSATLATDGEDVTIDGAAGGTWVERSVEGVTSLTVALADADVDAEHAETDFGVVTGLVRVSRIDRPPYVEQAEADVADVADDAEAAPVMAGAEAVDEPAEEAAQAQAPEESADDQMPDLDAGGVVVAAPFGGALAADAAAGDDVEAADGAMADGAAASDDAMAAEAEVAADEPSPLDEPAPFDEPSAEGESMTSGEPEMVMPPGGDPLTDPMPHAPAPSDWVTPWDTPPPPAAPAAPAAPEPEPADELAMTEEMPAAADESAMADEAAPMTDDAPATPSAEEPVTEFAPPSYAPPPPAADAPPVDLPPPPLPVGSWEPIGAFPPPPPAAPEPVATPPAAGAPEGDAVAKLMISDGQQVLVDRVILIGRAPEARRFTSTEQPHLVTVPSRLHEISSTHVEVRPGTGADQGSAVVTDMGSTNGTVLVQPGLGPEDLKPGIAVQLVPGAIINLGDGITIQVTRA
ncbi:FHA domain-containing protein [Nocardioides immobilis]|uniref:FHA domain-containing protein n=2 Tax=Nocardioides immobilis TaxID=2049295 RepID=A0A417XUR8_9ACTN|nr:FHA domain-containing protein [Nocardioides immobilis]